MQVPAALLLESLQVPQVASSCQAEQDWHSVDPAVVAVRKACGVPPLAVSRYQKFLHLIRFAGADLSDHYSRAAEGCLGARRREKRGEEDA